MTGRRAFQVGENSKVKKEVTKRDSAAATSREKAESFAREGQEQRQW
jgi:hypothetical protein